MKHHSLWINQILKSADLMDLDQNPNAFRDSVIAKVENYKDVKADIAILYHELCKVFVERMASRDSVKAHDSAFVDLLEHLDKMRGERRYANIAEKIFDGVLSAKHEAPRVFALKKTLKVLNNLKDNEPKNLSEALSFLGSALKDMPLDFADIDLTAREYEAYKELFDFFLNDDVADVILNSNKPNQVLPYLHAMCLFGAHGNGNKKGRMSDDMFDFVDTTMRRNQNARTGFAGWDSAVIKFMDTTRSSKQFERLLNNMLDILKTDQAKPMDIADLDVMMSLRSHDLTITSIQSLDEYFSRHAEYFGGQTYKIFDHVLNEVEGLSGLAHWRDFKKSAERKTCENMMHYAIVMLGQPSPDAEKMLERLDQFAQKIIQSDKIEHKKRLEELVHVTRKKIIDINGLDDDKEKYPKRKMHFDRPPYK